ncbi:MAG: T9SS type A sorting domain-containing protein, partial [Candidatus Eisenbacteria bacterium]|nr:T9SS type A sorting domain-containing protein [Candidatus Eisenbacteria bacterium]
GGSGGSLWLEVGGLEGSGVIRANGGDAAYTGGGGGGGGSGGRIAIYSADCFKNFDTGARAQVNGGGGGGANPSGKGTVLLGYANKIIAGIEDEFLAPTEPASPSANLVAGLFGFTLVNFDAIPVGGVFAHTFTGIPAQTQAAKVVFRARAGSGANVASDKVTLGYSDANGFHRMWSRYFGSTNGTGDPGLTGRPWATNKDTTFVIDVASLQRLNGPPVDATSLISARGYLDFVVEGNTGVDYALLTHGNCNNNVVGVGDPPPPPPLPPVVALRAEPNPFVQQTQVTFELPRESAVRLAAFDISGRRVQTLYEGSASAGAHHLDWRARSAAGGRLQAGVYFLRLEVDGKTLMRKVTLAR